MLKAANVEKSSSDFQTGSTRIGASCMQGWRFYMEDAHRVVADLDGKGMAFVGVYDAHVTPKAALFCAEKMHRRVLENLGKHGDGDLQGVLRASFLEIDGEFRRSIDPSFDSLVRAGGCTATVVLRSGNRVVVANVGDSRCVMARRGGGAEELTRDHKPSLPEEKERIEAAGGKVFLERFGGLNFSRGIGDFRLKIPAEVPPERMQMSPVPETKQVEVEGDDVEFVVVASDGVWECRSSEQVVEFVRKKVREGVKLSRICEELMDWCIKRDCSDPNDEGTTDNLTIVIMEPIRSISSV